MSWLKRYSPFIKKPKKHGPIAQNAARNDEAKLHLIWTGPKRPLSVLFKQKYQLSNPTSRIKYFTGFSKFRSDLSLIQFRESLRIVFQWLRSWHKLAQILFHFGILWIVTDQKQINRNTEWSVKPRQQDRLLIQKQGNKKWRLFFIHTRTVEYLYFIRSFCYENDKKCKESHNRIVSPWNHDSLSFPFAW